MRDFDNIPSDFVIQLKDRSQKSIRGCPHYHNSFEFFYLCEGELDYHIENSTYHMQKGSIVMMKPGILHWAGDYKKPDRKRILLYLKKQFFQEILKEKPDFLDFFDKQYVFLTINQQRKVEELFDQLFEEYYRDSGTNMIFVKALVVQLFCLIDRYTSETAYEKSLPAAAKILPEKIQNAIQYIEKNYAENLTLAATAAFIGTHPNHLSRTFKQCTNYTFSAYVQQVKLKHAADLLLHTDLNITQIALDTGYNSLNHFCKSFKKLKGISPLKFRKKT